MAEGMEKINFKLGVPQRGYGIKKNIPQHFLEDAVRPLDYFRVKSALNWRLRRKSDNCDLFRFRSPSLPSVDLLHFFNTVASTQTPWLVTFESLLPYFNSNNNDQEKWLNYLLGDSCRGIIAMSNHSKINFQWKLSQLGMQSFWSDFESKMTLLLPPEELKQPRQRDNKIQFVFVAREFYKKGGHVVVRVLDHLRKHVGCENWTAVLVGDLNSEPDETVGSFDSVKADTMDLIQGLTGPVTHFTRLPHHEVVSVMQQSHFLLHPTLQDTYGYVITEAMSCGCVPVTCAIRAIEEIVDHGSSGFLLRVKTDSNGNPKRYLSRSMWQEVEAQLKSILIGLFEGSEFEQYERLATGARKHIEVFHNPKVHSSKLLEIYQRALS